MPPEVLAAGSGVASDLTGVLEAPSGGRLVVARVAARRCWRSAALWGAGFGVVILTSVSGYLSAYPTAAGRDRLATSMGSNPGIAAVLGSARRIDTVTGFTAWRSGGTLGLIGSVWALLTVTRLLRGEEEAGRWELLLTGATTRARATAQAIGALLGGLTILWTLSAAAAWLGLARRSPPVDLSSCLFFATSLVAGPTLFAGVGAVTSQLAATRRQAAQLGAMALGYSFLVRALADSTPGGSWARWITPFGWVENLHPLTGSQWIALLPIVVTTAALVSGATAIAAWRDVGTGALRDRTRRVARTGLLGGPFAFSARLLAPVGAAWAAGLAIMGLVFGLVSPSAARALSASSSVEQMLNRIGAARSGPAAYLGLVFVVVASLIAFVAAGQVASLTRDELAGHLEHLLVRPVRRRAWLAGRTVLAGLLVGLIGLVVAAAAWVGAAAQGGGVGIGSMAEAVVAVATPGLAVLGVGTLAYGISPRWAPPTAFGLVTWSFVLELLGSVLRINHWLLDTSLLHHAGPAPAAPANWTAVAWLALIAVAAAAIGTGRFTRRDIASPE